MNRASLLVVTAQREELDPLILCIRAHGQTVKPLAAGRLSAVLAPALGDDLCCRGAWEGPTVVSRSMKSGRVLR